ncbi:MAG: hypothetical protein EAZ92_01940 [Candidatus Kapaibacterium sp.]|nr:MAG: hypothetical protein EAZ92_01940 [Candidatus Kapabacteria bacterium]
MFVLFLSGVLHCWNLPVLHAQHFLNDQQGNFLNGTGATLRIRANTGELRNTNANLTNVRNAGTIEFLGVNNRFTGNAPLGAQTTSRIGGMVRYTNANAALTQNLHARWYSNLDLSGASAKRIPDAVYIGGDDVQAGRFTAQGGMRLYEGTLYFDNSAFQTLLGDETYNNVEIQRGTQAAKRVEARTTLTTRGSFRQSPSNEAGLQIWGTLNIGTTADFPATPLQRGSIEIGTLATTGLLQGALMLGSGQSVFAVREVRVVHGVFSPRLNTAEILIQTGATLRLADISRIPTSAVAPALAQLRLTTASQTLRIRGNLMNERAALGNTQFHAQSLVVYEARNNADSRAVQSFPQEIMRTLPIAPYGNLHCDFSEKRIASVSTPSQTTAIISVAGDFRMNSSFLDLLPPANANITPNTAPNLDSSAVLLIMNPDARVEYTALSEVRGSVKRVLARLSGNYVFSNAATRMLFTSRTAPDTLTLSLLQGAEPLAYLAANDVRRRIRVQYSESLSQGQTWSGNLQLAYRASEIVPPFQPSNEAHLSFFAIPSNPTPRDTARRVATTQLLRDTASALGFGIVEQFAITSDAQSAFRIRSGEEIIIRGKQELMRSVANGRWSNPLTWNLLRQPTPSDCVEVRHTVHIGFRRNALDGASTLGQIRETASDEGTLLAQHITCASSPNTALLLGFLPASDDSTFADERPPLLRTWKGGTIRLVGQSSTASRDTLFADSTLAALVGFSELQRLKAAPNLNSVLRGLVLFTPKEGTDSAVFAVQQCSNAGIMFNGMRLETAQTLESSGIIHNAGTLRQRGARTQFQQAAMQGWTRFVGDSVRMENTAILPAERQNVPSLRYARLALEGRSEKFNAETTPILISDSLFVSAQANISLAANGECNLFGGMLLNGTLSAPRKSSLLRLVGAQTQRIQGFGTLDGLSIENPRGAEITESPEAGRSLVLRARLNLVQGAFRLRERGNLLLEDDLRITRRAESSLSTEPLRTGRIHVQTLGNRAMTATGELPQDSTALRTLSVLNAGGYTLAHTASVLDSLRISSAIFTDTAANPRTMLQFRNPRINPEFFADSAAIIGTVRRTALRDTLTRLLNNRFTSIRFLGVQHSSNEILLESRIIPQTFPRIARQNTMNTALEESDTTKVRRALFLHFRKTDATSMNADELAELGLMRLGYAWRVQNFDESAALETSRIVLQCARPQTASLQVHSWKTLGIPLRPTIRTAWNRASESGFWQWGVMDSVSWRNLHAGNDAVFRLALGVDSAFTVLPRAFLAGKVLLEGAFEPAYLLGSVLAEGRMRTTLTALNLLPNDFNATETAQISQLANTRLLAPFPPVPPNTAPHLGITDWLLLELRPFRFDAQSLWLPALVRSDGEMLGVNLQTPLQIELPDDNDDFQVFVHHRNHTTVGLSSLVKILPASRINLDFRQASALANSTQSTRVLELSALGTARLGMRSGDVFGNEGEINRFDYDAVSQAAWNMVFQEGYLRADADLNGIITTKDLNRIWNNRARNGATRKP